MSSERFQRKVTNLDELTSIVGEPSELVIRKQLSETDEHMEAFIARSPFVLLGTVGSNGSCDVSPRGDLPAVATVIDSRTLVLPDWKGNRRADSLRNIVETGRIGLLFLCPGIGETLRVNGRASVIRDEALLEATSVDGKIPLLAIGVEIEECFFQCAKALLRSRLWQGGGEQTESGDEPEPFDLAQVLVDQTKIEGQDVDALRQAIDEAYSGDLH